MIKKELKKIILKTFFIVLYLVFGCTFLYMTYNNSYWLIDNGNSGFVGKIFYNLIFKNFPIVDNKYSALFFISLTTLFFLIGSNKSILGLGKVLRRTFMILISSNKNKVDNNWVDVNIEEREEKNSKESFLEKAQQSFMFEKEIKKDLSPKKEFWLPNIDLLEKNTSKISISTTSKNRPDAEFMEKILLDFGIEGKIKKKMEAAHKEAANILGSTKAQVKEKIDLAMQEIDETIFKQTKESEEKIKRIEQKSEDDIRKIALELTKQLVGRFSKNKPSSSEVEKILTKEIKENTYE